MFNIFAILNSVVAPAIDAPAFDLEDTQEVPVLVLHTRPIDLSEILEPTQLNNALVDYQPFDWDDVWSTGNIVEAKYVGSDIHVLIFPTRNRDKHSLLPKWRNLSIHTVEYAWYAVAE